MRVAFVVADVGGQSPTYGTIYLAQAALRRGHQVCFASVDDLTFAAGGRTVAHVLQAPRVAPANTTALAAALASPRAKRAEADLGGMDVVFLRYNPRREKQRNGNGG